MGGHPGSAVGPLAGMGVGRDDPAMAGLFRGVIMSKMAYVSLDRRPEQDGPGEIIVNGRPVAVERGWTLLDAARSQGFKIPTLCHWKEVASAGVCGVCQVEDLTSGQLVRACVTSAQPGRGYRFSGPRVAEARRTAIRELILSGQHNCLVLDLDPREWTEYQLKAAENPWHEGICPAFGRCELQDLAVEYGVRLEGRRPDWPEVVVDDKGPMIVRDFSRCIRCGRCAAACNRIQVNSALPPLEQGDDPAGWLPEADHDRCTHCGECVQACPVGALFEKKAFGKGVEGEAERVRTTCPYCGVGCQQWLHLKEGRIVKVSGVEEAQPNRGRLCVKGRFGYDFISSPERLTKPLVKDGDGFREVSWEEALDHTAQRFKAIIAESGPDAVAGVSCARSVNEDSFQMQKLFRAVFGTNNIDHCART